MKSVRLKVVEKFTIEKIEAFLLNIESNEKVRESLVGDYVPYYHFLQFFKNKSEITEHDFYISTGFVYSWMPRMLKTVASSPERLAYLNIVLNGGDLDYNQLQKLSEGINNSIVGTSKLLHFISPDRYPIWDSRVYRAITGEVYSLLSNMKAVEAFIEYVANCRTIVIDYRYTALHSRLLKVCAFEDKPLSKIRTIELILFANG